MFLCTLFAESPLLLAQETTVKFEHLGLEEGLLRDGIRAIAQDKDGFLWVGTEYGLARFDGYKFTVFTFEPHDSTSVAASWIALMHVDREGRVWVNSILPGISRFEPETAQFTHFAPDPYDPHSLSDAVVSAYYEDRAGRMWIGTHGGGLHRYDDTTHQFVRYEHHLTDPHSLSHNNVRTLLEDHRGLLWVATQEGLNRYDPHQDHFLRYTQEEHNPGSLSHDDISSLFEDHAGTLWVGTEAGGLNRYDREADRFISYRHDPEDPQSLSHDQIRRVFEGPAHPGSLWVITGAGGVDRLDVAQRRFAHISFDEHDPSTEGRKTFLDPRVSHIYEDSEGLLWFGTPRGLYSYDWAEASLDWHTHSPLDRYTLSDPFVQALYEDRSGLLWVGTAHGLNKLNKRKDLFHHTAYHPATSNRASARSVSAIEQDGGGKLWVGTLGDGLHVYDAQGYRTQSYRHNHDDLESLSHDRIMRLYQAPTEPEALWVGTAFGLNKLDLKTGTFRRYVHDPSNPKSLPDNTIRSIRYDQEGLLWVGTNKGLARFDTATGTAESFACGQHGLQSLGPAPGSCQAVALHEARDGTLWVGMVPSGLYRFDRATDTFIHYAYDRQDPLRRSYPRSVYSIEEDQEGALWIGTFAHGLVRHDPRTGTFTAFTVATGLPNNFVMGILQDRRGRLWISTKGGLARFDPATQSVQSYDINDGLQSNEFLHAAYARGRQGHFFFGGLDGFNRFHPDSLKENSYRPPVILTSLQIRNRATGTFRRIATPPTPEALSLSYQENAFTFEMAALDFTNPAKNQYAYRLEGFDRDWIYSGSQRFGSYTNLSPGTYTLQVKGTNDDGLWTPEGLALHLIIVPPFWKTWWFYLLATSLLLVLGWYAHTKRVSATSQRLLELERIRTQEQERLRKKTAHDFHDELGHLATRITLFAEILKQRLPHPPPDLHPYLDRIISTSKDLTSGFGDYLWILNPEQDTLYDVLARLRDFGDDLFDNTGVVFSAYGLSREMADVRLSMDERRHLALLFKEGMHNILKHARCRQVSLAVSNEAGVLSITLADDGIGFEPQESFTGQGLQNMQARAAKLNAQLFVMSAPGAGTRLTLRGLKMSTTVESPPHD